MPLQIDYRPQKIDEIIGNDSIKKSLKSVLARRGKKRPHSFLFTGPPGCGKTTLARIIANELSIKNVLEYNTANTRGINTIRAIKNDSTHLGLVGRNKLYIMDEMHQITGDAMNAMLKLLEEPPQHIYFCLCTAEPDTIKKTIRDALSRRCHQYELSPLRSNELQKLMRNVIIKEGKQPKEYTPLLRKIIEVGNGSAGQCLKLLDETFDIQPSDAIEVIENITVSEASVIELCRLLLDTKIANTSKWPKIQKCLRDLKGDVEQVRYAILRYIEKVMLGNRWSGNAATIGAYFTESFMYTGKAGLVLACYMICFDDNRDDVPF